MTGLFRLGVTAGLAGLLLVSPRPAPAADPAEDALDPQQVSIHHLVEAGREFAVSV